jgi:hypothetical protein
MVEARLLAAKSEVLGDTKGAFVNIVTWASDVQEFQRKAESIVGQLGLFVSQVINPEPVEKRRTRIGIEFNDDIQDMLSRAQGNPDAIIYGTFHLYEKDDA